MHCLICHKPLHRSESLQRGMGPICHARMMTKLGTQEQESDHNPLITHKGSLLDIGAIIERQSDGRLACNFVQSIFHHSPSGMECGYAGSGPADMALNILDAFLPGNDVDCLEGHCSREAYVLHQDFKREFIAGLPHEGGIIEVQIIRDWIAKNLTELAGQLELVGEEA